MDFINHFKAARRVSTPLIAVNTFDAKSTIDVIRASLGESAAKTPLVLWDATNGMRALNPKGDEEIGFMCSKEKMSPDATLELTNALKAAESARTDAIIFMANAHLQWKDTQPAVIQSIWNLRDLYKASGNMLIMLCNPGAQLPSELTNDILMLDEPLPTVEELQEIVRDTFKSARVAEPTAELLNSATDALIGLPAFPADQATAMCLTYDKKGDPFKREGKLDISELWERKRSIISQTPGLSVYRGKDNLEDIGGIQQAKDFMRSIMEGNDPPKVILFMDEIEKGFAGTGTDMSGVKTELTGSMLSWMQDTEMDGCILTGIPGVSKSQLAKSTGGSYGRPVIIFDIAGMQSGIVGSSGANLRQAQKTVDAISGGRVLALATCNSMGSLPPELRRRFQLGTFFFDAPSFEERAAIWAIYRKKFNINASDKLPDSDGWTGAEIKECCKKAYRLRLSLTDAARYVVPVTTSAAEVIRGTRMAASGKYLSASRPGVYSYGEATTVSVPVAEPGAANRRMRELDS